MTLNHHNHSQPSNYVFSLFLISRRAAVRNIEVPEREFSRSSQSVSPVRPVTAPARARRNVRPRSPSHPNYKEEAYLQSTVVLRYVGHTDHYTRLESRARHRAHRRSQRLPPLPAHVDEVTIEQQPRGSYVLEVFHGYLAVGGKNLTLSNLIRSQIENWFRWIPVHLAKMRWVSLQFDYLR